MTRALRSGLRSAASLSEGLSGRGGGGEGVGWLGPVGWQSGPLPLHWPLPYSDRTTPLHVDSVVPVMNEGSEYHLANISFS